MSQMTMRSLPGLSIRFGAPPRPKARAGLR